MTRALAIFGVLAAFVGIAAGLCMAEREQLRALSLRGVFVLLCPFLFPPFILCWGLIFAWPGPEDTEPIWRLEATRWLCFLLYPGLCAFSVWRSRGLRPVAAALIPLSLF